MPKQTNCKESETLTYDPETIAYAMKSVADDLEAYRLRFRRHVLQKMLDEIDPREEHEQDVEDGLAAEPSEATPESAECGDTPTRRLQIGKARADVSPLVKWLLQCSPREKLAAIIADALVGTDAEVAIQKTEGYDGDIGHDMRYDFEQDVIRMIEDPDTTPADRAVAAWIMGAITTQ